uniref:Uncharacterized protein n=1 Tax=Glossina palpalis gambiensis TaxID=67801 RepID=A0A1B0AWA2_9MUSC
MKLCSLSIYDMSVEQQQKEQRDNGVDLPNKNCTVEESKNTLFSVFRFYFENRQRPEIQFRSRVEPALLTFQVLMSTVNMGLRILRDKIPMLFVTQWLRHLDHSLNGSSLLGLGHKDELEAQDSVLVLNDFEWRDKFKHIDKSIVKELLRKEEIWFATPINF